MSAAHWQISQDSTADEDAQEASPHGMKNGVHHVKIMPLPGLGCGSLLLNCHSKKSMCGLCEETNKWFWQLMPRRGAEEDIKLADSIACRWRLQERTQLTKKKIALALSNFLVVSERELEHGKMSCSNFACQKIHMNFLKNQTNFSS